jgi:hypothetical protein
LAAAADLRQGFSPTDGADLDLAMRLRRMGRTSLLLAGHAAAGSGLDIEPTSAIALGAFESAELAAAAQAFPARSA